MAPFFRRKRTATAPAEPVERSDGATVAAQPESGDPEEVSPLAERLRHMDWPTPSDEVRERCLGQIMSRVGAVPPKAAAEPQADEDGAAGGAAE